MQQAAGESLKVNNQRIWSRPLQRKGIRWSAISKRQQMTDEPLERLPGVGNRMQFIGNKIRGSGQTLRMSCSNQAPSGSLVTSPHVGGVRPPSVLQAQHRPCLWLQMDLGGCMLPGFDFRAEVTAPAGPGSSKGNKHGLPVVGKWVELEIRIRCEQIIQVVAGALDDLVAWVLVRVGRVQVVGGHDLREPNLDLVPCEGGIEHAMRVRPCCFIMCKSAAMGREKLGRICCANDGAAS